MDIKNKELVQKTIAAIIMIAVAVVAFIITSRFTLEKPKDTSVDLSPKIDVGEISKGVETKQTELDKLKDMQKIDIYVNGLATPQSLIENCRVEQTNQAMCNSEISKITKRLTSSGKIDKAKLYIKAGVSRDNGPLKALTQYDSIWFFLDTTNIAGHLLRGKALYSGLSEDGLSELIFDMGNLPITNKLPYSDNNPFDFKDVLMQLNSQNTHLIGAFVATQGFGKIESMSIYYSGAASLQIEN